MNSIVIGSGFGGIAAALRLKAKGHKVTLVEKHPDLGGRARVFKKNGFTYDGGPTVITAPYLINELFELFQKNPKDYIKLSPLKIWYQFVFEDNSKFNYSGDEIVLKNKLEAKNIFKNAREKVIKDISSKKEVLDKQIDEEIKKAEQEIELLKKSAPEKINRIAIETSSELIKKLIGAEINNSSISAIVADLSKRNGDKYYDN